MRPRLLPCLFLLPLALSAAVIEGDVRDITGTNSLNTAVRFTPLSFPVSVDSGTAVAAGPARTIVPKAGLFTNSFAPGVYKVSIGAFDFYIGVPDDSNTYSLPDLATNGLITYTYTNPIPYNVIAGATGIAISTNGANFYITNTLPGMSNVTETAARVLNSTNLWIGGATVVSNGLTVGAGGGNYTSTFSQGAFGEFNVTANAGVFDGPGFRFDDALNVREDFTVTTVDGTANATFTLGAGAFQVSAAATDLTGAIANSGGNLNLNDAVDVAGNLDVSGGATVSGGGITNHTASGFVGNGGNLTNLAAANITAGGTAPYLTLTTPTISGSMTNASPGGLYGGFFFPSNAVASGFTGIGSSGGGKSTLELGAKGNVNVMLDNDANSTSTFNVLSNGASTVFSVGEDGSSTQTGSAYVNGAFTNAGGMYGSGVGVTNVFDGQVILMTKDGARTVYTGAGAITNAVNAHGNFDTLFIVGTNYLPASVTLSNYTRVAGLGGGTIVFDGVSPYEECALVPGTIGTIIEDLTLWSGEKLATGTTTNTIKFIGTLNSYGNAAFTNLIIRNIVMNGSSDGIFILHTNACSMTLMNSKLSSAGDHIVISAPGIFDVFGTVFSDLASTTYPRVIASQPSGSYTNRYFNCTFDIPISAPANWHVFDPAPSGGTQYLELFDCTIYTLATNASDAFIACGGSSTIVVNSHNLAIQTAAGTHKVFTAGLNTHTWNSWNTTRGGVPITDWYSSAKGIVNWWGGNLTPTTATSTKIYNAQTNAWLANSGTTPPVAKNGEIILWNSNGVSLYAVTTTGTNALH